VADSVGRAKTGDRGGGGVPEADAAFGVEEDDTVADIRERE